MVQIASGTFVQLGISLSGLDIQVNISGDTVTVDPVTSSGLHVNMSGQHFYQESGAFVTVQSGIHVVSESGVNIVGDIRIIDLSGHNAYVGQRHQALVTEGYVINEVHNGELYRVCTTVSGLADDAHLQMLISPASGYELHAVFGASLGGLAHVKLLEDVQFSASGTPMTVNCMNRFTSGQPSSVFAMAPTITDNGNVLYCDVIGSAGKFGGGAGAVRTDVPWILQNVSGMGHSQSGVDGLWYALEVINMNGDAQDASISVEFSEELPVR